MRRLTDFRWRLLRRPLVLVGGIGLLLLPGAGRLPAIAAAGANRPSLVPPAWAAPAPRAARSAAALASRPAPDAATQRRVRASYGQLPLAFEANRGQSDPLVKFLARGPGYTLGLLSTEAVFVLHSPARRREASAKGLVHHGDTETRRTAPGEEKPSPPTVLRMKLVGANPGARIAGRERLPGISSYFVGNDPQQWHTKIPNYARVRYAGVYPGVDLVYYGNQRQLEYDFVVAPGADPGAIRLSYAGAERLRVDARGDLVLRTASGDLRQQKPRVYQEVAGKKRTVAGRYVIDGQRRVSFRVAAYDRRRPLVIDPVLGYSTFLGGSGFDSGSGIAVDGQGNAYVTGVTRGGFCLAPVTANDQVFVVKVNPSGTAFVYCVIFGGSGSNGDQGLGIAVDGQGNAYVTGLTFSTDFPTVNPFQTDQPGEDAFMTKLNAAGTMILYSTYLGGNDSDDGNGIAVDGQGNAYVTGSTASTNFPTTANAFQPADPDATAANHFDAFVAKLNPSASGAASLLYSTYLGGDADDSGKGIAVDGQGNAYVTGRTQSTDFPTSGGAFQQMDPDATMAGNDPDVFVTKLNPNAGGAAGLVYSTYLGGSNTDDGNGIAVDGQGNAYVTGLTASTNFPTVNEFQSDQPGEDAFMTKLNATGSALLYSTYLGGSGADAGIGIAVDGRGNAYVTGVTPSSNFPLRDAFDTTLGGAQDAFVAKLDPSKRGPASRIYSTYLGGSNNDFGLGIAVDAMCHAYVTGSTLSSDFPHSDDAAQPMFGGGVDGFVTRIDEANADLSVRKTANRSLVVSGATLTYTLTVRNNGPNAAAGVVLTDVLPPGTTFVSATPSQGSCITPPVGSGGTVTCSLGSLASGQSAMVTLVVKVTGSCGDLITNTATVSSTSCDPNPLNDAATVMTPVVGARVPMTTAPVGDIIAVLIDHSGTQIFISNVGTAPCILCQDDPNRSIIDEAFAVCVDGQFEVGASFLSPVNLAPATVGGTLGRPFYLPKVGAAPIFLTPLPGTSPPIYDLDDPDANPATNNPLRSGTLVQLITENRPTNGKCIGVRTTFQHVKGSCRLCKVRKFFNTCKVVKKITQVREFEQPLACGTFGALAGGSLTAVANLSPTGRITLAAQGSTGATPTNAAKPLLPSAAGSVEALTVFPMEFIRCGTSLLTSAPVNSCGAGPGGTDQFRYLELFLTFPPGGVPLQPVGKAGSEKLLTYCIDIQ